MPALLIFKALLGPIKHIAPGTLATLTTADVRRRDDGGGDRPNAAPGRLGRTLPHDRAVLLRGGASIVKARMDLPSIPSPCTGVCRLHPVTRLCEGCMRTIDEIGRWPSTDDAERLGILGRLRERRRAAGLTSAADSSPRRRRPAVAAP